MKSTSMLGALWLALWLGCGGATPQAAEPAAPAPATAAAPAAGDADPADDAAGEDAADQGASAAPALSATALGPQIGAGEVRFNFKPTYKAKKIFLAGNFNGWSPSDKDYLLTDEDGDGIWSITVKLGPGKYQYKFVADGQWTKDPHSPGAAPDGFGGQNGAFEVP